MDEAAATVARVLEARDHYAVLGCSPDAPHLEIGKAFRSLSLLIHPDKNRAEGAAEAFKKLSESNAVLSDAFKRRMYDMQQARPARATPPTGCGEGSCGERVATTSDRAPRDFGQHHRPSRPAQWESAEVIAAREKRAFEVEAAELRHEIECLRRDLHWERGQEKEREKKRQVEVVAQKRAAAEARAERDRMKAHWEGRLAEQAHRLEREAKEATARIALLEAEASAERARAIEARREAEGLSEALGVLMRWGAVAPLLRFSEGAADERARMGAEVAASVARPAAPARREAIRQCEVQYNRAFAEAVDRLVAERVAEQMGWAVVPESPAPLGPLGAYADERAAQARAQAASLDVPNPLLEPPPPTRAATADAGARAAAAKPPSPPPQQAESARTAFSVEKDGFGNFVVVEKDAEGEYTWSASRMAARSWAGAEREAAAERPPPPRQSSDGGADGMSEALASILQRLGLDLLQTRLEDEEIYDVPTLRSMGALFEPNMRELGLDDELALAMLRDALGIA